MVLVHLHPAPSPLALGILGPVHDVGVHFGEHEGRVVAQTNVSSPYSLQGHGAALHLVCGREARGGRVLLWCLLELGER